MASLEELVIKPGDLRNVRLANYLGKRNGAFPHGWNLRYIVLSANFIFIYNKPEDAKPKRVFCVDDCTVGPSDKFSKKPFAFTVTTRAGKDYHFAAESADDRGKWIMSINNAGYTNMYQRTREAVKFLDRCKELVAPFHVAVQTAASRPGGSAAPELIADTTAVTEDEIAAAKANMTGADVITALQQLDVVQAASSANTREILALKERFNDLEVESERLRADAEVARKATAEAGSLRTRVDELAARNAELQTRTESLNKELSAATAAAAKAARLVAGGASASSAAREAKGAEEDMLRVRIRELEAQMAREREDFQSQIRAANAAGKGNNAVGSPLLSRAASNGALGGSAVPEASPKPAAASSAAQNSSVNFSGTNGADASSAFEHEWQPFLAEAQRLEREGNYADAEQQYEAVLEAKRDRCGAESVPVASACRDLGRVLALQRRFDRAEDHYSRAVRLSAKLLGESHPNTACALTDLAAVLREQGKFSDAESYAARAVASLKAGVGPDDVSTATALYNLAGLAKRQGKFLDAEAAYGEALRIFRERLGEGQGETADTLYQMGCLYRKRNEVNKAGIFFQQAADAYSKTYGPADKRVAEASKRAKGMMEKIADAKAAGGSGAVAVDANGKAAPNPQMVRAR